MLRAHARLTLPAPLQVLTLPFLVLLLHVLGTLYFLCNVRQMRCVLRDAWGATWRSELMCSYVVGSLDALALHLCSEIAQGQVNCPPAVFDGVWALDGNL